MVKHFNTVSKSVTMLFMSNSAARDLMTMSSGDFSVDTTTFVFGVGGLSNNGNNIEEHNNIS